MENYWFGTGGGLETVGVEWRGLISALERGQRRTEGGLEEDCNRGGEYTRSNSYPNSIELLSKLYRNSIEILSKLYRSSNEIPLTSGQNGPVCLSVKSLLLAHESLR